MGAPNIIQSYLVSLGFTTDAVGYSRFAAQLRDAEHLVASQTTGIVKNLLEAQAAITGGFAAAGGAALGIVDKVAMADQQYRMLALRMYTTTSVARELKVAQDALGQPLENIMWDPELMGRFQQLVKDQQTMTAALGTGFESQMVKIRDFRQEVSRLQTGMEYLGMYLVKDFAKIFGISADDALAKFRGFTNWFIANMPAIGDKLEGYLVPIFQDMKTVLLGTWDAAKLFAGVFTNVVGIMSGDTSLQTTAVNFDQIATAVQKATHYLADFVTSMLHAEKLLMHLFSAVVDLNNFNFKGAWGEMKAAAGEAGLGTMSASGLVKGYERLTPAWTIPGLLMRGIDLGSEKLGNMIWPSQAQPVGGGAGGSKGLVSLAQMVAMKTGLPYQLILAQWGFETGGFTSPAYLNRNNLGGLMDRKSGGLASFQNLGQSAETYSKTIQNDIKRWGHTPSDAADFVKMLYGEGAMSYVGKQGSATPDQYLAGMQRYMTVNTYDIDINVAHSDANAEQTKAAVKDALKEHGEKQSQRVLADAMQTSWFPLGGS